MHPYLALITGTLLLNLGYTAIGVQSEQVSTLAFRDPYVNKTYYAGNKTTFLCTAFGGDPVPEIRWLLGPNPLARGNDSQHQAATFVRGTLKIFLESDMDGKALTCEADNARFQPVRDSVTLNIRYPSIVAVNYEPITQVVSCSAAGNPNKHDFMGWQLEVGNQTFPMTSNAASSSGAWQLQLNDPDVNDTGVYTCTASNGLGSPGIGRLLVQPSSAPIFIDPVESYQAKQYSNVTINLNVYASPLVTKYGWTKDGSDLPSEDLDIAFQDTNLSMLVRGSTIELPGQFVTLELLNVSLSDAGNYSLVLTTSRGHSSTLAFSLLVSVPDVKTTPAGPVTYEGGMEAGIIVLIVVIIINIIVCLACIVYWRTKIRSRRKQKAKAASKLPEKSSFLPREKTASVPPIPPKRTTSARRVTPKNPNSKEGNYAELEFSRRNTNGNKGTIVRKNPPTEYAWIDFKRNAPQPSISGNSHLELDV